MEGLGTIRESGIERFGRFYGVYSGFVKSIEDPLELNHLLLYIPEVLGTTGSLIWALPKGSFSGKGYGVRVVLGVGGAVWVTFRHGHPRYPLWEHSYFATDEKPEDFKELDTYGFITPGGIKVLLKDSDLSIQVETPDGNKISVKDEDTSIVLENKDGTKLEVKGKEILVNGGNHLTQAEELKKILKKLQHHLFMYSKNILSIAQVPEIGTTSVPPDIGLEKWKLSLKDFLTDWS